MATNDLTILAIADNRDDLTTLRAVVADRLPGARLLTAPDGPQGIELARTEHPDVILLDIPMPEMDGYEVCRRLKEDERLRTIPVLFLTALKTNRDDRIKALEAGAEGFLAKPLDEIELTAQIRAMAKVRQANLRQHLASADLATQVTECSRALECELMERKRAEAALCERENALRESQVIANLGSYVLDIPTGRWTSSEVMDKLFGIDETYERTVAGWAALLHPHDRTALSDYLRDEVIGQGKVFDKEYGIIRQNDRAERLVHGLGRLELDPQGRPLKMYGTVQDITERKRAENEIREMKAFLDTVINAIADPVFVKDDQRRFVLVNDALCAMTGCPRERLLGVCDDALFPEEQVAVFRQVDFGVLETGEETINEEALSDLSSKEVRTIVTRKTRFIDPAGKRFLVGVIRDITDRKRAEQERQELNNQLEKRNAELEQLTYTISHELKTPLVTIAGFVGQLRVDLEQGNHDCLGIDFDFIESAAIQMGTLMGNLLHLARSGRVIGEPHPVNLARTVREALELTRGVLDECATRIDMADDLPEVFGDADRLREVFQNLIGNAAKFTAGVPEPLIEIGGKVDGDQLLCWVRDNGIGIPAKYQEQVFRLFERLDPACEGTGIGLAIVHRIIKEHGGRIWVESAGAGCGSTFFFTLPMAAGIERPEP